LKIKTDAEVPPLTPHFRFKQIKTMTSTLAVNIHRVGGQQPKSQQLILERTKADCKNFGKE